MEFFTVGNHTESCTQDPCGEFSERYSEHRSGVGVCFLTSSLKDKHAILMTGAAIYQTVKPFQDEILEAPSRKEQERKGKLKHLKRSDCCVPSATEIAAMPIIAKN